MSHFMRVAVTGFGIVCPAGKSVPEFTDSLRHAQQRLGQLTGVPVPRGKSTVGMVQDSRFDAVDRAYRMCEAAVAEALQTAGVSVRNESNVALLLSTLAADSGAVEDLYPRFVANGFADSAVREALPLYSNGTLLNRLGDHFGFEGPRLVVSNACASGNIALGLALDMIRSGRCRVAVVPGVELVKLSMLWGAERSAFIGRALRPFHRRRDGSVLGEGAAAIVVQHPEDVGAQGVLGWLEGFGYGVEATAGAITLSEDGSGLRQSMTGALQDAARSAKEIEYINAHAPGTPAIDRIECKAIADLFGAHGNSLYVNSTKAISSHLSAASGIVEAIATLVQVQEGFVHGNSGLDDPDPALAVPVVGPVTISQKVRRCLSNACGGGGLNTTVVITAADEPQPSYGRTTPKRDVVITGIGAIAPRTVTDGSEPPQPGYLNWFDINQFYPESSKYSHYNRTGQLGAAAGALAVKDALLDRQYAKDRVAVITGTFLGGQTECNAAVCQALVENPNSITPSMVLDHGPHLSSSMDAPERTGGCSRDPRQRWIR
jgi:nodulation protein E